jgi:hypothetical protein
MVRELADYPVVLILSHVMPWASSITARDHLRGDVAGLAYAANAARVATTRRMNTPHLWAGFPLTYLG